MKTKLLTFLLSCIILGGCATASLAPVSKDTVLEDDEKRLWKRASEEQHDIDRSGLLYEDEALERYVNEVARKLEPPEIYAVIPFKVKVIKNPYLNAFALPNGAVYIHTGILARMDNEAQLATLLAHEMTHATNRHSVISFRGIKNKAAVVAGLQGTIGTVPLVGDMVTSLGALGATSSVYGHSRELESEADTTGLKMMVQAGYDPREAPKLFLHMKKELEDENLKEPFFFGTHPRLEERVDNFEFLLKKLYGGKTGILNREEFLKETKKMILDNAQLDLKAGRFSVAQRGIQKYLTLKPKDAHAYYLLGEVNRQRGEKGDLEKAKEQYQKAASLDSSYSDPNKGIGMIYLKQGNQRIAAKYFRTYLSLAPNAPDRGYIEEYIK
jgi:predicted Zn-dependent protease